MSEKIDVLRLYNLNIDKNINFSKTIFELKETKHIRGSMMEYAPQVTDCVSSVRYLIEKNTGISFPLGLINQIPFLILESNLGMILKAINLNKLKVFDLLFFRNSELSNDKKRIITHIATYIGEGYIFQSGSRITKKVIPIKDIYTKYNNISLIENIRYNKILINKLNNEL